MVNDNKKVTAPNQVWSIDITYIHLQHGFVYLTAIIDWYSRYIVGWHLDDTLDTIAVLEAVKSASRTVKPGILNSDQGCQFTSHQYTDFLKENQVQISMDGKGRWTDNIMIERWFRTFEYDEVYLNEYQNIQDARKEIPMKKVETPWNVIWKFFIVFGVSLFIYGIFFLLNESKVFLVNGALWICLGILARIKATYCEYRLQKLKKIGLCYDTVIINIYPNAMIRIGSYITARVECGYSIEGEYKTIKSNYFVLLPSDTKKNICAKIYFSNSNLKDFMVEMDWQHFSRQIF